MTYLGLDLGTSGIKALLIDQNQNIIGSTQASLDVSRPNAGWSEQNPADWIEATETVISKLRTKFPNEFILIKGIGLSGHMHGATLLNDTGKVLRPCMLWNDTRSFEEAATLDADPAFRAISGNIVFPGFTAPKVLWVKNNEPELFEKIAKVLLPKDYLRFSLTGGYVSEMSDAAGTSWLDVGKRDWSQDLLQKSHMRRDQMPDLVEGTQNSGTLKPELAAKWGLNPDVTIAGGAGDNAASAVGMGCVRAGNAFLSLGTSGVLFAVNDAYRPNAESAVHAFCHALPDTWHQMGVILSATDALNWLAGITGKSAQELDEALPETLQEPAGLTFLPYLSGERTPHNDAKIRGSFIGLHHEADTVTLTKAVLEGVSFAFKDCLDALAQAGTKIDRVTAVGGGSKSNYWLQMLSTVLNLPIDIPADGDFGAAFGAARLGLIAAENLEPASVCLPTKIDQTIEPNQALISSYDEARKTYQALYPALKSLVSS